MSASGAVNMRSRLPVRRAVFAWDLHYACNFRCPYCWYTVSGWDELAKKNRYFPIGKWEEAWERIYKKYGRCQIRVTAGEPFSYPQFVDLMRAVNRYHDLQITSNCSLPEVVKDFVERVSPESVELDCTFHPIEGKFDSFVENVTAFREHGFVANVCYLAYPHPLQMPCMGEFKRKFAERGIYMNLAIFWGGYRGKQYPADYSREEKQWIKEVIGTEIGPEHVHLEPIRVTGKLCGAGQKYAVVQTDGTVCRCGQIGVEQPLGNIFDAGFELYHTGMPCPADYCRCKEFQSAWTEEEKEQFITARSALPSSSHVPLGHPEGTAR